MSHIEPADDLFTRGQIGDWAFDDDEAHILLMLPGREFGDAREGSFAALPIKPDDRRPSWAWDGNREAPTLTPSILHHWDAGPEGAGEWHGYLTAGRLVPA